MQQQWTKTCLLAKEYTLVCDYLLYQILMSNATWPGVLGHRTKNHVCEARLVNGY